MINGRAGGDGADPAGLSSADVAEQNYPVLRGGSLTAGASPQGSSDRSRSSYPSRLASGGGPGDQDGLLVEWSHQCLLPPVAARNTTRLLLLVPSHATRPGCRLSAAACGGQPTAVAEINAFGPTDHAAAAGGRACGSLSWPAGSAPWSVSPSMARTLSCMTGRS